MFCLWCHSLLTDFQCRGEDLQKPFEGLKHALEKECEAHYEKIRSDVVSVSITKIKYQE